MTWRIQAKLLATLQWVTVGSGIVVVWKAANENGLEVNLQNAG